MEGAEPVIREWQMEQMEKVVFQVGNLAETAEEEQLLQAFSKLGIVFEMVVRSDVRTRLNMARCLKKVAKRIPNFLSKIKEADADRVREALKLARQEELDHHDEAYQELVEFLEFVTEETGSDVFRRRLSPKHPLKEVPLVPPGQVVLQVRQPITSEVRTALLGKVLILDGVLSVTFEEGYVIVATRSVATADPTFLSKLMNVLIEQGVLGELFSVGEATGAPIGAVSNAHPLASASGAGSSSTSSTGIPTEADREDDGQAQADPAYLDDEHELKDRVGLDGEPGAGYGSSEGRAEAGAGAAGVPQWTFFSQRNWMMERRLQEYEDDPTIASRLANKKKQQQKKREEDTKRFRWLSSWIGLHHED